MNENVNHHTFHSIDAPPVHTTKAISSVLFDLASRTQELLGDQSPRSLIIGTHPDIPLTGDGMLSSLTFKEQNRTRIVDTPLDVLDRLRHLVTQNYRRYACVMAAFETHHFEPRFREDLMDLLEKLSHGTVIMADYSLAGVDTERAYRETQSTVEIKQQKISGGFEKWLPSHAVFTPHSFLETARQADWSSFQGFTVPHHKVGMIASPTLTHSELRYISEPVLL